LEQRRRPTAKLQNDFALYHPVAMKLKHPPKAALIDECGKAETYRLRYGKIVHRAFCQHQLRNPGSVSGFGWPVLRQNVIPDVREAYCRDENNQENHQSAGQG